MFTIQSSCLSYPLTHLACEAYSEVRTQPLNLLLILVSYLILSCDFEILVIIMIRPRSGLLPFLAWECTGIDKDRTKVFETLTCLND